MRKHNIIKVWSEEYRRIFSDTGAFLFLIALPLAYPILYALIYNPEVVHDSPIAVVDNSRTHISRELCRRLDASPATHIVAYCANLNEAKALIHKRECLGILEIPYDFNHKIERKEQSAVIFYSDMSILLNYKNYLTSLTDITLEMGKELQSHSLTSATDKQIAMETVPIPHYSIALYNPCEGFASFLMPALLIIILQQSLLLGIGLLSGGDNERNITPQRHNITISVLGKGASYLSLYIIIMVYVTHFIPWIFHYPQWGNQWEIYMFLLPFLLASIYMAMTIGNIVRERESVFLIVVFTSMIFLFISGVTWPYDRMPTIWRIVGAFVPSTWGVEGFLRMSTDAASLYDVKTEYLALWSLAIVYLLSAVSIQRYMDNKDRHDTNRQNRSPDLLKD